MIGTMKQKRLENSYLKTSEEAEVFEWDAQDCYDCKGNLSQWSANQEG